MSQQESRKANKNDFIKIEKCEMYFEEFPLSEEAIRLTDHNKTASSC